MLKLYSYFRSSASYRARIALHYKGLEFETIPVHLLKDGGQQRQAAYRAVNPMGHVPALDHDGFLVAESMAILQYLDDLKITPKLFPSEAQARAKVFQICEIINSGIQPLQNLKVNQALEKDFGLQKSDVERWNQLWIKPGLASLEKLLTQTAGTYSLGGEVTAADCFLVPQAFSSRRMGVDTKEYPTLTRIEENCLKLKAFELAHPSQQPDYQA